MTIEQQAPFQFTWREIVNEEYQEWFKRHLRAITVFDHRPSMGQHRKPKQPTLFQEIILEAGIENDLRQILGEHFDTFKNNFEMVANPAHLKDGGIFLDGWKTGQPDKQAAAFVYYPGKQAECMRLITTDAKYSIWC